MPSKGAVPPDERAELIHGGVDGRVREVMEEAARFEPKFYLERLQTMQKDLDPAAVDLRAAVYIDVQIRRLRRALGIKPTPEERRAQTRIGLARYRANKRAKVN